MHTQSDSSNTWTQPKEQQISSSVYCNLA